MPLIIGICLPNVPWLIIGVDGIVLETFLELVIGTVALLPRLVAVLRLLRHDVGMLLAFSEQEK